MKLSIQILISFSCVVLIGLMPISPGIIKPGQYYLSTTITLLPGVFTFTLICVAVLFLIILLAQYQLKQPLNGVMVIARKDMNLARHFIIISTWAVVVLMAGYFLDDVIYIFRWVVPYC